MAKWQIELMEQGERYATVEVEAESRQDAIEASYEAKESLEPDDWYWKIRDSDFISVEEVKNG